MKSNELKHLGNILAELPENELHEVLVQLQHKWGYTGFQKSKENYMVDFLKTIELLARVDSYDYWTGGADVEEHIRQHKEYPDVYLDLPHVFRLSEEELQKFISIYEYIKNHFNDDTFIWSDYEKIYQKIVDNPSKTNTDKRSHNPPEQFQI